MSDQVKTLGLLFDNDPGTGYSSGQVVLGHVLIELYTPITIKSIELHVEACGYVGWTGEPRTEPFLQRLNSAIRLPVPRYAEVRKYSSLSKTLLEATDSTGLTLEAGRHEMPFQLKVPRRALISSFTGKYGRVCYWVRAVVLWSRHYNQYVRRELPVVSHIDVSLPQLLRPVSQNKEKMIGWWIFASGPISLNVRIERKGYSNGESIPIYAEIKNFSSRLVITKAAFYQIQTYMACGKSRSRKKAVASVRGSHVPSGCSDAWNGRTLKIPPVSPSILNCDILRVEYSLAVIVQIPGARKLKVELPIVIGTTPYSGTGSRNLSAIRQLSFAVDPSLPPEAPPNYADVVSEEDFEAQRPSVPPLRPCDDLQANLDDPAFAYIQECRFQPPPLYSEVDPNPEYRGSVFGGQ